MVEETSYFLIYFGLEEVSSICYFAITLSVIMNASIFYSNTSSIIMQQ